MPPDLSALQRSALALRGPDAGDGCVHLGHQPFSLLGQAMYRVQHLAGGCPVLPGCLAHPNKVGGHFLRACRGRVNIPCDFRDRGPLLLDPCLHGAPSRVLVCLIRAISRSAMSSCRFVAKRFSSSSRTCRTALSEVRLLDVGKDALIISKLGLLIVNAFRLHVRAELSPSGRRPALTHPPNADAIDPTG